MPFLQRRRLLVGAAGLLVSGRAVRARASAGLLDAIRAAGRIRIGTSGNAPPYTGVDFRNTLTGYDIAWGELVAHGLGVAPDWVKIDFRGLMAALQAGQVDALMSGIRITPQRAAMFGFSRPYSYEATVAVAPAANSTIHDFAGIAGHDVAVVAGSFQEQIVRATPGVASVMALPGASDVFMSLRTGHAEVAVLGATSVAFYRSRGFSDIKVVGEGARPTPQGIVLPHGASDLKAAIDPIIDAKFEDGTYLKLYLQYFHMQPPNLSAP
ncbi:substrate-binding periplasmic protein [Lichenicoccus sp.]|uniref:substrate-binding periplasmic protein n=1 Tax=Lichenicoccus sp. TaxID=2781899 RepID=UPI003D0D17D6